jgi:D-alanyl-D-alanine carboxypeptidase
VKSRKKYLFIIFLILNIALIEYIKSYDFIHEPTTLIPSSDTLETRYSIEKNSTDTKKPKVVVLNSPVSTGLKEAVEAAKLIETDSLMAATAALPCQTDIGNKSLPDINPSISTTSPEEIYPDENAINDSSLSYSSLPHFKMSNLDRYYQYQKSNPELTYEQIVTHVNIGLDFGFYQKVKTIEDAASITVLVNKYNRLPDSYIPDLIRLDSSMCAPGRGEQYLRKEAAEAFTALHRDAKKLGLNITAYGTYRSYQAQQMIWERAVNRNKDENDADNYNARSGHSEHHTGLAIDVITNDYSITDTEEFSWYKDKIHQYGFIIRYPKGKEHITGYKYEPWHLRYVGPEIATEIYKSGLTYEEYYVSVLEVTVHSYAE